MKKNKLLIKIICTNNKMSTIGDIITQLSTSTPLSSFGSTGDTWTSQSIVMAEYNSISLIFFSDKNSRITINWSADGVHWDFIKTYVLEANTQDQISMITYSKWCYITIQNLAGSAQTILRSNVYATVSNNAVTSNIQGDTANVLPEFSVKNSFDYNNFQSQHVESWSPQFCYNFAGLTGGLTGASPIGDFYAGYDSLQFSTSSSTGLGDNYWYFDGSSIMLGQPALDQNFQTMVRDTKFLKLYSGIGNRIVFTASFLRVNAPNVGGVSGTADLLVGAGYASNFDGTGVTNPILDGLFFGYEGVNGNYPQYQNSFGIFYFNNGVKEFIAQSAWNVDRCDGGGPVPAMPVINATGWQSANTFSFSFGLNGSILCYVQNPNNNKFQLVHVIQYGNSSSTNTKQNFFYNRFSPIMYTATKLAALQTDNYLCNIRLYSYMSGYEQNNIIPRSSLYTIDTKFTNGTGWNGSTGMSANNKYVLMYIKNSNQIVIPNNGTITNTNIIIKPQSLILSNNSSSSIGIDIYANYGVTGLTGPNYANQFYSPLVYYDNNDTNHILLDSPNGTLIYRYNLIANSSVILDLAPFNYIMYPNTSLVVVGTPPKGGVTWDLNFIFYMDEFH